MEFTAELWESIGPIYEAILRHPFLSGLTDGSLPRESFKFYAVQDALYLREFARALSITAARAPRQEWIIMFNEHAAGALRVERELHESFFQEFGLSPEMVEVIEKITGDKKYATPYVQEKRPEIVRWHEDVYAVTDALGLCAFASTAQYYMTPDLMADLFAAATGIPSDADHIMRLGRKIVTMERAYNTREGATRKDDVLPRRLMTEESVDRPGQRAICSPEILDPMLDQYYALHGWDVATARPTRANLESLDLGDWAGELGRLGYLPSEDNQQ
jgi:aldehyde:ferredoxin oxidoreductase